MATVTITQLPNAGTLTGTEVLPIVQSDATVKTTVQDIANLAGGIIAEDTGANSTVRVDNNNCASGCYATISGGKCNTASGNNSTIAGGYDNTASCVGSTVSGGGGAFISNWGNLVCLPNTANGCYSTIGGGRGNTASGCYTGILGGKNNTTNGCDCAMIIGSCITADMCCTTFVNCLSIKNIPTGSEGLCSGMVWNDSGSLKIIT
jgi:hypothetical protein